MWVPLAILAVCAALVGMVGIGLGHESFLQTTPSLAMATHEGGFHMSIAVISTLVAGGGVLLAVYLYLGDRRAAEGIKRLMNFQWMTQLSDSQWVAKFKRMRAVVFVNRVAKNRVARMFWLRGLVACIGYVLLLAMAMLAAPLLVLYSVSPYKLSSRKFFIDEAYDVLIVRPLRALAAICFWIDRWLVDGLVNSVGRIPVKFGSLTRSLQMGLVPFYALAMVL